MDYLKVLLTDVGISRKVNEDSLYVDVIVSENKKALFSIICDGMGGLSEGEVASSSAVRAFYYWSKSNLPEMLKNQIIFEELKCQWDEIIFEQNQILSEYGRRKGIRLGTTLTALLIVDYKYYAVHVGDSRIYEISDGVYQLTSDHSVVARDVRRGNITLEQAKNDPRRNILLQCIGASETVEPEYLTGEAVKDTVFMLCTDGFWHNVTEDEIYSNLNSSELLNEDIMLDRARYMIEINKSRLETDNISIILVRTF
jgi:serine/threonine protein phosphatase PrpC